MEIYYKSGVTTFMLAQAFEHRWMEWQGNYVSNGTRAILKDLIFCENSI